MSDLQTLRHKLDLANAIFRLPSGKLIYTGASAPVADPALPLVPEIPLDTKPIVCMDNIMHPDNDTLLTRQP